VHISALQASGLDRLDDDERVEFELIQLHDGRVAAFGIRVVPPRPPETAPHRNGTR
jgi:cold shock CspA family protein